MCIRDSYKSPSSQKFQTKVWLKLPLVRSEQNNASILFGLQLTNPTQDKEVEVHGWVSQGGTFVKKSLPKIKFEHIIRGDNDYTIADAAGNIPSAITVGAYTSRSTHINKLTKKGYNFNMEVGRRSYFSSMGPVLNTSVKKPTVLAPGAQICSAYNKLYPNFDKNDWLLSEKVTINGEDFYYADEQGTSMASPYVAGVIARCVPVHAGGVRGA